MKTSKKLYTERLELRPLVQEDWPEISFLRSDPAVNKFVQRPVADTKDKALAFIEKIRQGSENKQLYYWAITRKQKPTLIGTICLWNFSEDKRTAELGYDLSPTFQGKGIMRESLMRIIQFGQDQLSLNQFLAYTNRDNQASIRLLEKQGFQRTAIKDPDFQHNIVFSLT